MNIITRFAPSPTGFLHVGNYRTALFAYIFAKQNKGQFVLRIEDTDKLRSKKEYENDIIESLKWLGLDYDSFYRQSDRVLVYEKYIQRLIDSGRAYISKEIPKDENDRDEVIRFRNPNKVVVFDDLVRGPIEFDTTQFGDFIIARNMKEPVFHLVVVVDDGEVGTTHIIRGEDHISNTTRHILLYEALGMPVPKYVHIPLLLDKDRTKLSKRKGALPITAYRDQGYLPEAVINCLALLGWHPIDDVEILSIEDIIKQFSFERVQKASAIFDIEKLNWFNREYILRLNDEDFDKKADPFIPEWLKNNKDQYARIRSLIKEKISVFSDIAKMFEKDGDLYFVKELPDYNTEQLLWKKSPNREEASNHLLKIKEMLANIAESDFIVEKIKNTVWEYVEKSGRGNVLWPFRVAITGQEKSPDPFNSAYIVGKKETLDRLNIAINKLNA